MGSSPYGVVAGRSDPEWKGACPAVHPAVRSLCCQSGSEILLHIGDQFPLPRRSGHARIIYYHQYLWLFKDADELDIVLVYMYVRVFGVILKLSFPSLRRGRGNMCLRDLILLEAVNRTTQSWLLYNTRSAFDGVLVCGSQAASWIRARHYEVDLALVCWHMAMFRAHYLMA